MAIYRSSQLSWDPSSANINSQFINFINSIAASGDTLHLEGMFNFNVGLNHRLILPPNLRITAENGCGLDVIGGSYATSRQLFRGGSGSLTLDNVLFQSTDAPETGFQGNNPDSNPPAGGHYHRTTLFEVPGRPLTIRSCTFRHNFELFLDFGGANALDLRNSAFYRGKGQLGCQRGSTNVYIHQTLFSDAFIDGIKTVDGAGNASPNTNWLIDDSIFEKSRDGIDLTGGLQDSEIRNTIFRNLNVCAIDAKILLKDNNTTISYYTHAVCRDFTCTNCDVIDTNSALVLTFLGQGYTYSYALQDALVPQRIHWTGGEFVRTTAKDPSFGQRPILDKMGKNCSWSGIRRGAIVPPDDDIDTVDSADEQAGWNSYGNTVTFTQTIPTRPAPDDSVHFVHGQGGVAPPPDPDIPPAPVSAGEAITVHPSTGLLTINRSLAGTLSAAPVTVRAQTPFGTASDTFNVTLT